MNLDFLTNVKVEAVAKDAPKGRTSVPKLPETADIRVFANGRVYPSKAFAASYDLEFQIKGMRTVEVGDGAEATSVQVQDVVLGCGLDIFSSEKWGAVQGKMGDNKVIFICAVPKTLAKVDMWNSTGYDKETGAPKASIFTQGANTFAKEVLVPMIADVYGVNWGTTEFVDLVVAHDTVMSSPNNIYHLPKIVSSGKMKGEDTYVRRENLTICPLVVAEVKGAIPTDDSADVPAPALQAVVAGEPGGEEPATVNEATQEWSEQLGGATTEETEEATS